MDTITFEQIPDLFASIGQLFVEKKEELCGLDAKLGDGDLGLTMSKGFSAIPGIMRNEAESAAGDIGRLLMKAGMNMSSLIPSTMGFLMSSGILEGGKALRGITEMGGEALAEFLAGFAAGIQKRGKCQVGQRTVYDAVKPAADAAMACAQATPGTTLQAVITSALQAAAAGVESTKTMVPVFGKAAVHAAQCAGIADQGAIAGYYVILGISQFLSV